MGLLLFRAFLAINAFNIATENPVTPNPYRFPVYSVNECPKSENEFKTAAQRRNCTRGSRYLCAPNKYISSLIEFCTDRPRSLYREGNCVLLEGTGDLYHYSCEEKFNSSCPLEPYFDEDIFKYPACLEIDRELRCFVADNNCSKREFSTIETPLNISTMETVGNETFRRSSPRLLAIVYIIAVVSAGVILILVIFQKRRKEQGGRYKKKDENKSLLKDPEPPIEQNDDVQFDQTAIHNQIQTTSTDMLYDTVKEDTEKSKTIQREEKRKEESVYKTATSEINEWEDSEFLKQKEALKARKNFKEEEILTEQQSISGYIQEIDEWEDSEILNQKKALKAQRIFKDEEILKKHLSISGYIHGTKNGLEVVKVFLRYDDKIAKLEIKDNILEGLKEEFIIIPDRIQELKNKLFSITKQEHSTPGVDVVEMNRVGKIISNQASYLYKNHSDVIGLRISNVRCVDGKFKQEPCIVIYCLDKSFIPSGENKLPETLEGYPCDIRENIIMFGGGASIGSSIGIPYSKEFGSVGFLVKSNVPSLIPVSGFLTAAHVAIKELDKLHDEKALLSECKQRKRCEFAKQTHFIVQPAWPHSDVDKPVGEVVESFCGNYKPYGKGKYNPSFGIDAAFIKTYPPMPEVKEESIMEVMDGNSLIYDRSTKVLKRGHVTGETHGILISNTASIAIGSESNNEYEYQFNNCYEIRSEQSEPFFKAGDSGSAVFVLDGDELKPLGIAFAFDAVGKTWACRIDQIVQAFNLSIYQEEEDMDTQDD